MSSSARYWRVANLSPYSSAWLELASVELWDSGTKLVASLSCAIAPVAGTLANLSDADLGSSTKWLVCPGLAFVFDLGHAATVQVPRFGAAGEAEFVASCTLEHSADGLVWLQEAVFNQIIYPGAGLLNEATFGSGIDSSVMLQISADGIDGATTFTDASSYAHNTTRYGAVAISTAQSVYGGSSIRIPASSCLMWDDSSILDFGAGDFTLSMRLRFDSIGLADFFNNYGSSIATSGLFMQCESNGSLAAYLCSGGSYQTIATVASVLIANTWQHIELGRSGNVFRLFVGGEIKATLTNSLTLNSSSAKVRLGAETDTGGYGMAGYVDDLIIIKGSCLHTTDFTPGPLGSGGAASLATESPALGFTLAGMANSLSALLPPADFGIYLHGQPVTLTRGDLSGWGRISGTVKVTPASPVKRRVRLHREIDGLLVSETWSDATTGAYQFDDLNLALGYTVLSYDHTAAYRAVIADRVVPEAVP